MDSGKGMEFNIVVVLAIAVLGLLLVGTFYTGAFKSLTGKTTSFAAKSLANSSGSGQIANCNMLCTATAGCDKQAVIKFQETGCETISPCEMEQGCVQGECKGITGVLIDGIQC